MSLNHCIDTYLKVTYEDQYCVVCETNIATHDDLCRECYNERHADKIEAIREAFD